MNKLAIWIQKKENSKIKYLFIGLFEEICSRNQERWQIGERIHMNISADLISSDINKYREWKGRLKNQHSKNMGAKLMRMRKN
jgi:hypothetical protein